MEISNSDWLEVDPLQWKKTKNLMNSSYHNEQLKGFVHKSRIQIIEQLPLSEQKKIISDNLIAYKKYCQWESDYFYTKYDTANNRWKNPSDSLKLIELTSTDFNITDKKFNPILSIFPKYICQTKDTATLQLLFSVLWEDRGSANEMPSSSLGESYVCSSDFFLNQISSLKSIALKDLICGHIEWWLCGYFEVDCEIQDESKITNKEYLAHKKKLETARK